jgi:hypothetical protein
MLDELIDRVAADLTQTPHDTGLGERVVAILDRGRVLPAWMPAAALAGLIVAVIGVSLIQRPSTDRLIVHAPRSPDVPMPPPETDAETHQRPPAVVAAGSGVPKRVRGSRALAERSSTIPPLAPPSPLSLDAVMPAALSVPAVEIEALDVSLIAIDELTLASEAKEYP